MTHRARGAPLKLRYINLSAKLQVHIAAVLGASRARDEGWAPAHAGVFSEHSATRPIVRTHGAFLPYFSLTLNMGAPCTCTTHVRCTLRQSRGVSRKSPTPNVRYKVPRNFCVARPRLPTFAGRHTRARRGVTRARTSASRARLFARSVIARSTRRGSGATAAAAARDRIEGLQRARWLAPGDRRRWRRVARVGCE